MGDRIDWHAVDAVNKRNLDHLPPNGGYHLQAARQLVLIGPGHDTRYVALAEKNGAYEGTIEADGRALLVTGVLSNRSEFQDTVQRVTTKAITFK
jgi:hypothetical protein